MQQQQRIPISRLTDAYSTASLVILLVLAVAATSIEIGFCVLTAPSHGEVCGINDTEMLWSSWMIFDVGINFVISLLDIAIVIMTCLRRTRPQLAGRISFLKMIKNLSCVMGFLWIIYGSELFLTYPINKDCRDYLVSGSIPAETPFITEVYLEEHLHGAGQPVSFKPGPNTHKVTKTYVPTWLTPFGVGSGWCSAAVLRTISPTDSVGECQQHCFVTPGCRAAGFRDGEGGDGQCKLFASNEAIKGMLERPETATCYVRGICSIVDGEVQCQAASPEQHAAARGVVGAVVSVKPSPIDVLIHNSSLPIVSAQNFTEIEEKKKEHYEQYAVSCKCKTLHNFGWHMVLYRWVLELVSLIATFAMVPVVMGVCRRCMRNYDFTP